MSGTLFEGWFGNSYNFSHCLDIFICWLYCGSSLCFIFCLNQHESLYTHSTIWLSSHRVLSTSSGNCFCFCYVQIPRVWIDIIVFIFLSYSFNLFLIILAYIILTFIMHHHHHHHHQFF